MPAEHHLILDVFTAHLSARGPVGAVCAAATSRYLLHLVACRRVFVFVQRVEFNWGVVL